MTNKIAAVMTEADVATQAELDAVNAALDIRLDVVEATFPDRKLTAMTAQNTTSGTSIDFTSIPSWVNRITVMFDSISTNGTSALLVQIGAGSVQSSGYASQYWAGGSIFSGAVTAGFGQCSMNGGSNGYIGSCVLTRVSGNKWVANGSINIADAGNLGFCNNGVVSLSGALDRVRLTTLNGTDTFDAGSVNVLYE